LGVQMLGWFGWRASFWLFGAIGAIWCVLLWRLFRDDPATHSAVSREELAAIRQGLEETHSTIRFGALLRPNLIWLCLAYFCVIYGLYFYLTWLPTPFKEARRSRA